MVWHGDLLASTDDAAWSAFILVTANRIGLLTYSYDAMQVFVQTICFLCLIGRAIYLYLPYPSYHAMPITALPRGIQVRAADQRRLTGDGRRVLAVLVAVAAATTSEYTRARASSHILMSDRPWESRWGRSTYYWKFFSDSIVKDCHVLLICNMQARHSLLKIE